LMHVFYREVIVRYVQAKECEMGLIAALSKAPLAAGTLR